ncbi:hypothetical protein Avbf_10128 [Armadillidium vulgare]|nr:hypothetical protein Avbf_10128 [Armadillidium vulgare]
MDLVLSTIMKGCVSSYTLFLQFYEIQNTVLYNAFQSYKIQNTILYRIFQCYEIQNTFLYNHSKLPVEFQY